jgi:hypothetical protein
MALAYAIEHRMPNEIIFLIVTSIYIVKEYGKTCKVRHRILHKQLAYANLAGQANYTTCQVQYITLNVQDPMMHLTGQHPALTSWDFEPGWG